MDTSDMDLLTPLKAAAHLGITPALLAAYCRPGFRSGTGDEWRLHAETLSGRTRFRLDELDRFDRQLRLPWSPRGGARPSIPDPVTSHLKSECRNECSRCGEGGGLETAHIEPWAQCLSHHHHNLIRLCNACHEAHDVGGLVTTEELRALKGAQVAATRAHLLTRIDPDHGRLPPPRPAKSYFGRGDELDRLVEALRTDLSVLVTGVGGIGKTELVVQALELAGTGREVIWLDVERLIDAEGAISALRRTLSAEGEPCAPEDVPAKLDRIGACLVFDGLERGATGALEELEDAIAGLHAATRATQFVCTSQVASHRLPADLALVLDPLDADASGRLLAQARRGGDPGAIEDTGDLLEICGGHALTLKLAGALAAHFGSAAAAVRRIRSHGGGVLALPARTIHDSRTSLSVCLALAYEALTLEERMTLWLIANAPGGLYARQFEDDFFEFADGGGALAGLRRWHFAYGLSQGGAERVHVLSPVRLFAVERFRAEEPAEAERLLLSLLNSIGVVVAVIEMRSTGVRDVDYMLFRYEQEMPNIRRLLDGAAERPDDGELLELALTAASSLVRYFFILQLGADGAALMERSAELALASGRPRRAAALALQAVALGRRVTVNGKRRPGADLLGRIEQKADGDPQARADLACARAILALDDGDAMAALSEADEALSELGTVATTLGVAAEVGASDGEAVKSTDPRRQDLDDDLASALRIKGDALLALGRHAEAAARYRQALRHVRGSAVAVNSGQLLHQIGNCEGRLGNHEVAARHYVGAAHMFAGVGLREFLGKALGELGYVLLDWDGSLEHDVGPELFAAALEDLERDLRSAFLAEPFNPAVCVGVVRRTYGTLVVGVFRGMAQEGGEWALRIGTEVLAAGPSHRDGVDPENEAVPLITLDIALHLAFLVAELEDSIDAHGDPDELAVRALLELCCGTPPHPRGMFRLTDFLSAYLTRRLGVTNATPERLDEFAHNADMDVHDELDLHRPRR